ncbi:MAG: hypothetical protein IPM06_21825 [Rhizobiales bacterium]|nr:hypothetical protein [Hyphomicrobiales bacterium]
MEQVIDAMIAGREMVFGAHGVMRTAKDKIWMPNGLAMRYDGISRDEHGQASYFNGRNPVETIRRQASRKHRAVRPLLHRQPPTAGDRELIARRLVYL